MKGRLVKYQFREWKKKNPHFCQISAEIWNFNYSAKISKLGTKSVILFEQDENPIQDLLGSCSFWSIIEQNEWFHPVRPKQTKVDN